MSTFNTNTGSVNDQLMLLYTNLGGVMNPDENSASYSVQGWLAKINEVAGSISNGQIINGVANFWQDTPPATRIGGDALVAGDQWYKPADNGIPGTAGDWIWTGSDWVSADTKESNKLGLNTVAYELIAPLNLSNRVYLEGVASQIIYTAPVGIDSSPTNYWTLQIRTQSSVITTLDGRDTNLKPVTAKWHRSFTPFTPPSVYTYTVDTGLVIYKNLVAVGSPATLVSSNWEVCLVYRYIHP